MESNPFSIVWIIIIAVMFVVSWVQHSRTETTKAVPQASVKEYGTKQVVDDLVLFDMMDD